MQIQELQEAKHSGQSSAAEVDALTAKLVQAEAQIRDERVKAQVLHDKVRQMELDIEAIPILKAQVEVYQSDFNAERAAREKIAGEKADLQEEIRKIQQRQNQLTNDLGALPVSICDSFNLFHFNIFCLGRRWWRSPSADWSFFSKKSSKPDGRVCC